VVLPHPAQQMLLDYHQEQEETEQMAVFMLQLLSKYNLWHF
jgi:hypothetical protein